MTTATSTTHERYIHSVRQIVVDRAALLGTITQDEATKLTHAKLLYGVGDGSYRGICYYGAWENGIGNVDVVEIAATGQESFIQLAGTTVHELGHVLAPGDGHGSEWKAACVRLGFTMKPKAAGQIYRLAMMTPVLRHAVYTLAGEIGDGTPTFSRWGIGYNPAAGTTTVRPCSQGQGVKGGTSRGKGSGSRLRLWVCNCPTPVKVRVASDDFQAHCDKCNAAFRRPE